MPIVSTKTILTRNNANLFPANNEIKIKITPETMLANPKNRCVFRKASSLFIIHGTRNPKCLFVSLILGLTFPINIINNPIRNTRKRTFCVPMLTPVKIKTN